jgi:phospholipid-binding lipoprotein MlaA
MTNSIETNKYSSIAMLKILGVSACALILTSCSDVTNTPGVTQVDGTAGYAAVDEDPLEPFNRGSFRTHRILDQIVFRPVAKIYQGVVPDTGRTAVSSFLSNITSPVDFVNSVLQGDANNAFATFWRFALNSTMGLGGLYDFAGKEVGLKAREADFGQTMARYGVASGPYLFLPVFGPTTLRDGTGRGVDMVFDPVTWTNDNAWSIAEGVATGINFRSENMAMIDDLQDNSLDPYTAFRSAYLQHRANEIREWMPEDKR